MKKGEMMMGKVEERLEAAGIVLPEVPVPLAAYVPGVVSGKMVYTSGQLPMASGSLAYKGRLGEDASVEEGYAAARQCAVNCLGVLKSLLGDLDRVTRVVKVVGFVNSAADFEGQPKVLNGASELLQTAFGDAGVHARSAVGVSSLPLGAMCEVEIAVEYHDW
ncbi:RidA family protein [Clostridium sp. AN503]|uniref:RidA family protein n=1 Tax=Clostridium sp. AN503 TaxID=3160598 RepID=UPI0034576B7B